MNSVFSPPNPLDRVAMGMSCQALKFSICTQDCQAVVNPQGYPARWVFWANSTNSGATLWVFEGHSSKEYAAVVMGR